MTPAEQDPLLAIVTDDLPSLTESFIQSHLKDLPARVVHVYGWRPMIAGRPVLPLHRRLAHTIRRRLTSGDVQAELTEAYMCAFRKTRVSAVLAEYGEVGADVVEACRRMGLPLTVHFHGYDASAHQVLAKRRAGYQAMFEYATAIIAVSRAMESKLFELGAPREKLHYNPYGVELHRFGGATPAEVPPGFLTVGRFVPKKAPDLALRAFARVHARCPEARLRMIGGGPMLEDCRKLAVDLGIDTAVEFAGFADHGAVQRAMVSARCFVQHSIVAPDGDSEGLPVAILEAGASGLPVIATRHAGIPDVVVENVTGYLVDEGDVDGMAAHMLRLARDSALAARLGAAGRSRIQENFEASRSLRRLWDIISAGMERRPPPARSEVANRRPA